MKKIEEKKESFFARHFKKKRSVCSKCKNDIDAYMDKCPYCGSERSVDILPNKYLNMTFLSDYKELCFFFVGTLGLILISFLIATGFNNFPIKQPGLSDALSNLLSYIAVLALFFCIISHDTRKLVRETKRNTLRPFTWIFVAAGLGAIIGFSYGYRAILAASNVVINDTANQKLVTELVRNQPAIAFFFVVLFAPIIEEFTYRVGLFSLLRKRNRWLAYIVTVLLFTFVHFLGSFVSDPNVMANEALNIPLYIIPSIILAVSYEYAGLQSSLYIHILNNLLTFILVLTLR